MQYKLYAVRHGETQWNAENRVCGRTDLPLTPAGLRQAAHTAELLAGLPIERIYSSPMLRARQTAQAAADRLGLRVETDPRLTEQDYGVYEGLDRGCRDFLANKRQFAYPYPKGESMFQTAQRIYNFLDERGREEKNILVVAHKGVIRILHTYFHPTTNDEFFHFSLDNCEIREYVFPTPEKSGGDC